MSSLERVPISSLQKDTKNLLSLLLNPSKVIATDEGLPRDWRGLAHLVNISGEIFPALTNSADPTAAVLSFWIKKSPETNLNNLTIFLEKLDRFDVIDDCQDLFEKDAENFLAPVQTQEPYSSPPAHIANWGADSNVLTVDDANLAQQGFLHLQTYDAFVLFADEDIDFATELIERMEDYGFKLCVKDRDLLGGLTSEHSAVLQLIAERCTRMLVIISPAFLQSPANTFFMDFAQALGIEQRQRKIVPCLYKRCTLPPQLSYYFLLDYQRSGRLWNFWDKLRDSLRVAPPALTEKQRATVREIESDASSMTLMPCRDPMRNLQQRKPASSSPPTITITSSEQKQPSNYFNSLDSTPKLRQSSSMVHIDDVNSLSVPINDSGTNLSDSDISDLQETMSDTSSVKAQKYSKPRWFKNFLRPSSSTTNLTTNSTVTKKKKKLFKRIFTPAS